MEIQKYGVAFQQLTRLDKLNRNAMRLKLKSAHCGHVPVSISKKHHDPTATITHRIFN